MPATVFIGFAFAGAGIAAVTYMRSWQDFDILNLAILPMFLFSATFFPLSTYPDWLEWVIRATPLYNGVDAVGTLVGEELERRREPGLLERLARLEQAARPARRCARRRAAS